MNYESILAPIGKKLGFEVYIKTVDVKDKLGRSYSKLLLATKNNKFLEKISSLNWQKSKKYNRDQVLTDSYHNLLMPLIRYAQ
ncbi:MAG: hypothetical protein ACOCUH_04360 [Bacteriovoracia bacterium]